MHNKFLICSELTNLLIENNISNDRTEIQERQKVKMKDHVNSIYIPIRYKSDLLIC